MELFGNEIESMSHRMNKHKAAVSNEVQKVLLKSDNMETQFAKLENRLTGAPIYEKGGGMIINRPTTPGST